MPIKFLHDIDADGEVKGTSLDINGAADISGATDFGGDVTLTSAGSQQPLLTIKTTHTTTTASGELQFLKDAADTEDGENLGLISFYGEDEGNNNTKFAHIKGLIVESTNGQEGGAIRLAVAAHDGEMVNGLQINDGSSEDEIDVIIGSTITSLTTVAGNLLVNGTVSTLAGSNANFNFNSGSDIILEADNAGGGNASSIQYLSSDGNKIMLSVNNDVVQLCNRTANGTVTIKANTSTAGSGGETLNSTYTDTAATFAVPVVGNLTGNVTGNTSGSSGSCTGNAATATKAAITSDTGSATHFPVFVDTASGNQSLKAHSSWTYNPGTSTLVAGKLTTDVASIVENNKSNSALMTLTGQGAGDESNVSLKMLGTSAGNPIKLKMSALDDGENQVGAGFLSYDAEDDSFGVGQSSSHNRMGIKIENTITVGSVHYEPTSVKAREFVASANNTHYDFNGDIMRNGNDTVVRGKMYCYKNGTWTISNADTLLDGNGLLGIALGTNSTTHGMLLKGTYTLDYDPGSNGNPLYVSLTDGLVATAVPGNSGDVVRIVGYLLGGTHGNIFFNPDSTYVEVA